MSQNPLAFRSFSFVDMNGYRWSAYKQSVGPSSPIILEVETGAPYSAGARKFENEAAADPKELETRAKLIALGWKQSGGAPKRGFRGGGAARAGGGGGFPWWLLLLVGYAFTRKGR